MQSIGCEKENKISTSSIQPSAGNTLFKARECGDLDTNNEFENSQFGTDILCENESNNFDTTENAMNDILKEFDLSQIENSEFNS